MAPVILLLMLLSVVTAAIKGVEAAKEETEAAATKEVEAAATSEGEEQAAQEKGQPADS